MRINLTIDEALPGMNQFIGGLPTEQRSYMLKVFAEIGFMTWNGVSDPRGTLPILEQYVSDVIEERISNGQLAVIGNIQQVPVDDTNINKAEDTVSDGTFINDEDELADDSCTMIGNGDSVVKDHLSQWN